MPTDKKVQQVEDISEAFKNATGCWFIDARGLTVKQSQQLRRNVRAAGGSMHVYKNTLAVRALEALDLPTMPEILAGPTAFVFCDGDVAAPAKVIKTFAKENPALEFKGGLVDGNAISVEDAMKIADLPSKEVLVSMLLSTLQAPISGLARVCNGPVEYLARAIKAIAEQKQQEAA